MIELPVINEADQLFSAVLDGIRVTFRLRYSPFYDRWSMDLSIDDEPVIYGRRIVVGSDLLAPYNLGIGSLIAIAPDGGAAMPANRTALPNGQVRLYHFTADEVPVATSSLLSSRYVYVTDENGAFLTTPLGEYLTIGG